MLAVDIVDYSERFEKLRADNDWSPEQLSFVPVDVRYLADILEDQSFDICCFQRAIHYLNYQEALDLLRYLRKIVKEKLFISVTGLESDIGINYPDKDKRVSERFCQLILEDREKFSIHEPVCLYTPEEFMNLLQTAGFEIEEFWVSAFGNQKVICS